MFLNTEGRKSVVVKAFGVKGEDVNPVKMKSVVINSVGMKGGVRDQKIP